MNIEKTAIEDVFVITPTVFEDARGFFMENFRKDKLAEAGINIDIVQENYAHSYKNVLRGLHFQWDPPMGKLMRATVGRVYMVAVDIRKKSKTFGKWVGIESSAENKKQLYAPAGFARAFCVLSEFADVHYICTGTYNKNGESGILWNDPAIGISWPVERPILSERDAKAQTLADWIASPESNNF